MSAKLSAFLPRLREIEASDAGSLAHGHLVLEMATALDKADADEALALFDQAEGIFRHHHAIHPDAAMAGLSHCLNNRSALLADQEDWQAAIAAASEAVTIRRLRLAGASRTQQDAIRMDLGYSLGALARAQAGAGHLQQAIASCGDALQVLQDFAGRKQDPAFVLLGKLIGFYVQLCTMAGRKPDAALLMPLAMAFTDASQKKS
ncbi:hypothetical protein [Thalassospira sp.]|uniref:hypothetical protein n=1 Tax=Thalassospira sp. TaxID=1912094 RepID=UPI0027333C39|nr:hypothetical protein [Thalassospira sp.]MDP2700289.1 hypothetical protein [Thalassospira sp.]